MRKLWFVGFWFALFLVAFYGFTHRGESPKKQIDRAGLFEPQSNKAFSEDMAELVKTRSQPESESKVAPSEVIIMTSMKPNFSDSPKIGDSNRVSFGKK